MFEVEAKVRLDDPDALRERVLSLGGAWSDPTTQDDTFFGHPLRDFAATDEALRLRRTSTYELTYKGPRQEEDSKVRREHNVRVEDDPTLLLVALGMHPQAWLTKTRETARLDGCAVEIDHVEGLGTFLEVEAVGEDAQTAGEAVERVLAMLGMAEAPRTTTSYLEMALEAGAASARKD